MPATQASVDLANLWRPIEDSFAEFQGDCTSLVDCTDSILGEVESIQHELTSRARELELLQEQLALRERQLVEQRTEFGRLSSQFDQQAASLEHTTAELSLLRQEVATHAFPATLAADSARLAIERAGALWQEELAVVLDRLNALTMLQPRGTEENAAVQAFSVDLSDLRGLVSGSQAAFEKQLVQLHGQLKLISDVPSLVAPAHEIETQINQALTQFCDQLAQQQAQARQSAAQERDDLLQRIDSLTAASRQTASPDVSPLFNELIGQLGKMQEKLDRVHSQAGLGANSHESLIVELKTELARLHMALQERHEPVPSSNDELLAELRGEVAILRQVAEEARQQTHRQETERRLVETELDRVRTQAAQWRRELEEATCHYHQEERLWHEELHDLRHLIQQAAGSMASAALVEPGVATTAAARTPEDHDPADPVANTLLAQFAKLQKDQARRRTRAQ